MDFIKRTITKKQVQKDAELLAEEKLYEYVGKEIEAGNIRSGLWTKATSIATSSDHEDIKSVEPKILETLAISDHEASFMDDIERLRASDLVPPELVVSAHLYDVKSGRVSQVVPPAPLNKK